MRQEGFIFSHVLVLNKNALKLQIYRSSKKIMEKGGLLWEYIEAYFISPHAAEGIYIYHNRAQALSEPQRAPGRLQ